MIKIRLELNINLEKIILIIFFTLLLFIGPGNLFDHRVQHEFPYAYSASDAFQHQTRAEAVKDAGNFRYEAFYISKGFEKVVGRYPPIIYHISVILSYAAGLEVYDAIYFVVSLFMIIGAVTMYFVVRNFNKNVALISLPLAMLIFSHPLVIGLTWGHWPSLFSQFFLIALAWCVMNIDLDKSYMLISIAFASIILAHTSEAVFAIIFIALFLGFRLLGKNLQKYEIKNIITGLVIALIISSYYLAIFKNTWAKSQPYAFAIEPLWKENPGFYIADFGVFAIFIAAGLVFSLFKLKNMPASLAFGLAMLFGGFLNYIGFGLRSFQVRFFWPVYLSTFFGLGIYMLSKFFIKKWSAVYSILLFIILTFLLIQVRIPLIGLNKMPGIPQYNKITSQGIMDAYHWSALEWLSKNTEVNSKIYFFYGDTYNQDALLRNSKRFHYQVDPDDFIKALSDRKTKRYYISELPGDSGGTMAVRTGYFTFEDATSSKPQEYFFGLQDICNFGYLVFDKVSRQQVLAQYNLLIASELLKRDYISKAFENDEVVILKNNKIGGDCIEERSF